MMKKSQKIGFFGGSFDPFHLGHLNLALEILEKSAIEKILICPTSQSPFKKKTLPIDIKHRIAMIQRAIKKISNLELIKTEAYNKNVSYTYETLCQLKKQGLHPTLILSDDLLYDFEKWHQGQKITEEYELLVAKRDYIDLREEKIPSWLLSSIKNKILPIRLLDICSSEIRKRLKNKLYCEHLLPSKTLDYIYKYKLYF